MYKSEILSEVEEKVERRKCNRPERMCSVCEERLEAERKRVEQRAGNKTAQADSSTDEI
jgi:hypothetical protein